MYALMYRDLAGFILPYTEEDKAYVFDKPDLAHSELARVTQRLTDQLGPVRTYVKGPWWKFWDPLILVVKPNPLQEFQRQNIRQVLNTIHVKTVKVI